MPGILCPVSSKPHRWTNRYPKTDLLCTSRSADPPGGHMSATIFSLATLHILPFQWDAGSNPPASPQRQENCLAINTKPAWQAQDARSQQPFLLDFLLTGILSLLCLTGAFLPWAFPSFFSLDQVLESWVSWDLVHILIVCDSWEHLCSLTLSFRRKRQPLDT